MEYVRCQIENKNGKKTVWIPEKLASKGKSVKIRNEGTWEVSKTSNRVKSDKDIKRK